MLLFKESWTRSAPSFLSNWRSPQHKLWLLPEILLGSEMPPARTVRFLRYVAHAGETA